MSEVPESSIRCETCCKNQFFTYIGILLVSVSIFFCVLMMALGSVLMTFGALETGFNLMISDGFPEGAQS